MFSHQKRRNKNWIKKAQDIWLETFGVRLPFELIEIGKSKIIEAIEVSAESIILKLSTFLQHTYSTE